jgi:integrase
MEKEIKKQRITNKHYRQFLDTGMIQLINNEDIIKVLNNVEEQHQREIRALIICLYFTGARPCEVLSLKAKDFRKDKSLLEVQFKVTKKHGLPRTLYFKLNNPLIKELYDYTNSLFEETFIFYNFVSKYKRAHYNKKGDLKIYYEVSDKLRYHFKKWFSVIDVESYTPYFLRHNRFSKLAGKGVTMEELRLAKGSKTLNSITPYLHLSTDISKKLSKKFD